MSIQIAKVELAQSPSAGFALSPVRRPARVLRPERPATAARGIVNAVLMAVPMWALIALTLYLLM